MSRFKKFLGDLEIKVKSKDKEGKEIEERFVIKPTMEDRLELMEKFQIKDIKEKYKNTCVVLVNIFKKSKQGDETDEEIMEFVDRYFLEIIKQITIAFGWTTEEQIQKQVDIELKKQVPEGSPI
jgi:hypothetical protein